MKNPTPNRPDDTWSDCPAGAVSGLVGRLKKRRHRKHARQVAAGVSCVAIVLIAGAYAVPYVGMSDSRPVGFMCADVHRLADEYLAGRLDEEATSRIETHLEACRLCRQFLAERRKSLEARPLAPIETVQLHHARRLPADVVLARVD